MRNRDRSDSLGQRRQLIWPRSVSQSLLELLSQSLFIARYLGELSPLGKGGVDSRMVSEVGV